MSNHSMLLCEPGTWEIFLEKEKHKTYYKKLIKYLEQEKNIVYPPVEKIFEAYKLTPFSEIKVVIIGQDPYHGPNQAHGLAFSVENGIIPPSLKNIYKELQSDLNISPGNGNLTVWAQQGVFLLNTSLTVQKNIAASHADIGWQHLTDNSIKYINEHRENIVFLLWGKHAARFINFIDTQKHYVLTSSHPSPLSAYRGFLGCGHFSACNNYLQKHGKKIIRW